MSDETINEETTTAAPKKSAKKIQEKTARDKARAITLAKMAAKSK